MGIEIKKNKIFNAILMIGSCWKVSKVIWEIINSSPLVTKLYKKFLENLFKSSNSKLIGRPNYTILKPKLFLHVSLSIFVCSSRNFPNPFRQYKAIPYLNPLMPKESLFFLIPLSLLLLFSLQWLQAQHILLSWEIIWKISLKKNKRIVSISRHAKKIEEIFEW